MKGREEKERERQKHRYTYRYRLTDRQTDRIIVIVYPVLPTDGALFQFLCLVLNM